ncbi:EexN family lipoprotein [Roseomonas mucosa]|uniref:EexN family lipoprotein n=1 Tax=Roseomonas mucosa TaxID=207340 RepID=UPI0036F43338
MLFGVFALVFWSTEREAQRSTVSALRSEPARLSRILAECRNDPGRLANTSQCHNAEVASGAAPGRS